jgi:hypothetical protein
MGFKSAIDDLRFRVRSSMSLGMQDVINPRRAARVKSGRDPNSFTIEMGRDRQVAHHTWFRGDHVNYLPTKVNLHEADAVDDYILKGWLPARPFITKSHYITAFGSCFAAHMTKYLAEQGFNIFGGDLTLESHVVRCGEGMVNTFAISQQFEWAYGEKPDTAHLWHDKKGQRASDDAALRDETRSIFDETDVFIITLGLSEVWYDKQTGEVFWRAIPKSEFDEKRHGFKVSTVEENRRNLETIYRLVREHRPEATMIFTLSPVPLVATFRPVSCLTANAVSKAVLRVAVDEFKRAHEDDDKLFYFPSYEIVKDYARDPYDKDNRHIRRDVVQSIMKTFARHYLVD